VFTLLRTATSSPLSFVPGAAPGGEFTVGYWQQFTFILTVCLVVLLAWLVTRFIARRGAGVLQNQSRYLNVLERLQVAPGRYLLLVTVAGKVLLVGQGERELSVVNIMNEEELIRFLELNPLTEMDTNGMTFLRNLQQSIARISKER